MGISIFIWAWLSFGDLGIRVALHYIAFTATASTAILRLHFQRPWVGGGGGGRVVVREVEDGTVCGGESIREVKGDTACGGGQEIEDDAAYDEQHASGR